MNQITKRVRQAGFALPTVLIASVVMLAVLSASVAAATSTRSALLNQYYDTLATDAAESGMAMAKECMEAGFSTWANPLRPGGTCAGLATACTDPSCYLVNTTNIRTSFEVSTPAVAGDISTIKSQGITEQLRTTGGGVTRSFSHVLSKTVVSAGGGVPEYSTVESFAGSGPAGGTNGPASSARFDRPYGVAVDSVGNVFVSETDNHVIRKIALDGTVSTFAGNMGNDGDSNGTGTSAGFDEPYGIAIDSNDNIYVADTQNHVIRKITPSRVVTTFAGDMGNYGDSNGTGTLAEFNGPKGVAVDSNDNIYVADTGNNRIRKITQSRVVTTFAGSSMGYVDATGTSARFRAPTGVAVDSNGNVFVADESNHVIRKITPAQVVTTFAGSSMGYVDGTGSAARFKNPFGIAIDQFDTIYVTDSPPGSPRIRKITPDQVVTTFAGTGSTGYANGALLSSEFDYFGGIAVGHDGTIYIADNDNNRVRSIPASSYVGGETKNYYF